MLYKKALLAQTVIVMSLKRASAQMIIRANERINQ